MKTKFFLLVAVLLNLTSFSYAQSVRITPKKVTYTRPKPIADFKRTFEVTYPRISGLSSALNKKVESAVSFAKVSNLNVKEEQTEIQWLEEASYTEEYNKKGILCLILSVSGTGAYPSTYNRPVVVDLVSGNRIMPRDVFTNLPGLAAMVRKAQLAEIKSAKVEIKKEDPEWNTDETFKYAKFTTKELSEFVVSDKGVTFKYDYGFPHVALALQPNGTFFFSWKQLKPFINKTGRFGQFVR